VNKDLETNATPVGNLYKHYLLRAAYIKRAYESLQECKKGDPNVIPTFLNDPINNVILRNLRNVSGNEVKVIDPNEKTGPGGMEAEITGKEPVVYTVFFENLPTATAAAQQVTITDDLTDRLDWTSFELQEIAFGDRIVAIPPGNSSYYHQVAFGEYRVDIQAQLNSFTGRTRWILTMIDPVTGALPLEGEVGFLPPNNPDVGNGEGHVTFSISPATGLRPGTEIRNKAVIVFDANPEIPTNETVHIVGASAPDQPIPISPRESAQSENLTPILTASEYLHPIGLRHTASQFEVRGYTLDGLVWDSGSLAPTSQTQVPAGVLEPNRQYAWRVRYQSENEKWSQWSDESWFGTGKRLVEGDFDGDGDADHVDFFILVGHWQTKGPGDMNGDGWVDENDLLRFLRLRDGP
jgi:hypothetical protein